MKTKLYLDILIIIQIIFIKADFIINEIYPPLPLSDYFIAQFLGLVFILIMRFALKGKEKKETQEKQEFVTGLTKNQIEQLEMWARGHVSCRNTTSVNPNL